MNAKEAVESLVACAYAKGVADGCKHMLQVYQIYVTVQKLHCVGVMRDGFSALCPYGDDETKTEYTHSDLEGSFETKEQLAEQFKETTGEEVDPDDIEELTMGYIWVPVEFFLTIKGAEEYIKANAHNHEKLRTYVNHFEHRNFEMNNLLEELGFKTK
jgi:hypothetical protein